jgi:tRNA-dihydrouridine synthase
VAGNGDISSAEELLRRGRGGGEGCDAVMAGRAAVRAPWIFTQARRLEDAARDGDEPAPDLEETALRFLDLLSQYQPREFHLGRARRFFHYYCDNFTWAQYLRNLINREETLGGIAAVIRTYCGEHPEERRRGAGHGPYYGNPPLENG